MREPVRFSSASRCRARSNAPRISSAFLSYVATSILLSNRSSSNVSRRPEPLQVCTVATLSLLACRRLGLVGLDDFLAQPSQHGWRNHEFAQVTAKLPFEVFFPRVWLRA